MENFCINMRHIHKVMEGGTVLKDLQDMQAEGARKRETGVTSLAFLYLKEFHRDITRAAP